MVSLLRNCPLCGVTLVNQPAVVENYRTVKCYGKRLKSNNHTSESQKCGYEAILFNEEVIKEKWNYMEGNEGLTESDEEKIKTIRNQFNAQEVKMSFDLSGYTPEKPSGGDFEPFNYDGPVKVNYARIVSSDEASDFHKTPAGANLFEMELEVTQGEYSKRKFWKRFNLDSQITSGKKNPKTPVQKLADQLFQAGIEFKDLDDLRIACEKLVTIRLIVKARKAKINNDVVQVCNISGVAPADWAEEKETADIAF